MNATAANSLQRGWQSLCPPAQIYPIVMTGLILFNLYRGTYAYAISHIVAMLIGTTLLWVLCAANLEFVAYGMLILPVLFFVFLLAVIFYDQSLLSISHSYRNKGEDCDCCETRPESCFCC
jgi:hypothetical protein